MSNKITIKGTPRQYCADELQAKQQKAVRAFLETSQSLHRLHSSNHACFFNEYADLVLQGYRLAGGRLPELAPENYTVWLKKPQSALDEETAALEYKIKLSYYAELEFERVEFEAKLVAQMLETDLVKETKAQKNKLAKKLAEYQAIAANTYAPLNIPNSELHLG